MATTTNNPSIIFDTLSRNLSSLAYAKSENDKIVLKKILGDFNTLNYNDSWSVVNERAVLVVNQCCFLVNYDDEHLVTNVLQLFYNILSKLKVNVEGKTLSVAIIWLLNCLKRKKQDQISLGLLVLQELVRGKSHLVTEFTDKILDVCKNFIIEFSAEEPPQICLSCLNCLEALVSPKDENFGDNIVPKSLDIFLKVLYEEISMKNSIWKCKCIVSALHGLSNIAERDINLIVDIFPEIFGSIKGYMFYGAPGIAEFKIDKVLPSNIALPEELKPLQPVKKSTGKYDRKSKKKNLTSISNIAKDDEEPAKNIYTGFQELAQFYVTSDSDFSENEGGTCGKLRHLSSKVRRCALVLLGTLLMKGDLRNLTRFLPSFLWDGVQTRTLITCLLKDPSASVRSEVLTVLSIILTKFKPFLSLADSITKSSFTTLSNHVAEILKNIHMGLTAALRNENYKIVTTQILKTISDLVRCSPYSKLEPNMLTHLAKEVAENLKKKDINVQIASLVVFGCIAFINPQIEETRNIILGSNCDPKVWLFSQCTAKLNDDINFNTAIAVECLQVLAALIRNFPIETVVAFPDDVIKLLEFTTSKYDFYVRLYAAKLTEAVVCVLQMSIGKDDPAKRISVDLAASIWRQIIHGPLTSLIQSEDQAALRSAACNCFASLAITNETVESSLIFDELTKSDQIICITHLFGCVKDEEAQVRSAADRALAVLIQFPQLRHDPLFFLDTTDLFFTASNDANLHVRTQAAWLFRHIAEAGLANFTDGIDEELSDSLILRLLNAGINLTKDQKKGIPYAVRGIANLLTMTSKEFVTDHKDEIHRAVDALVINATSGTFMKARWNSCYALGAVLANQNICSETRSKIFPALFELVQKYKNFKVRISAGHALASAKNRESYQEFYLPTWRALLISLENAQHMTDFSEYQHRDHLVDQLCSCMCHLASIITSSDLIPLEEIIQHHTENLNNQFQRFKNRIVPEKGSKIVDADSRLSGLRTDKSLSRDQQNALTHISNIFLYDFNTI